MSDEKDSVTEDEIDPDACQRCESAYVLRHGQEPTPYCDECAHNIVEEQAATIEAMREEVARLQRERRLLARLVWSMFNEEHARDRDDGTTHPSPWGQARKLKHEAMDACDAAGLSPNRCKEIGYGDGAAARSRTDSLRTPTPKGPNA